MPRRNLRPVEDRAIQYVPYRTTLRLGIVYRGARVGTIAPQFLPSGAFVWRATGWPLVACAEHDQPTRETAARLLAAAYEWYQTLPADARRAQFAQRLREDEDEDEDEASG
jgi:hypothetical protein